MRRIVAVVVALAGLLWLATTEPPPAMATGDGREAPNGGYGVGIMIPSAAETRVFAESNLCLLEGVSSATVTGLRFVESRHLRILDHGVRDYAVTPQGYTIDVTEGSLDELGFRPDPVTVPCGDAERVVVLGYEVAVEGGSEGWGKRLVVSYVADGRPGRLVLPVSIRMCVGPAQEPYCMPSDL